MERDALEAAAPFSLEVQMGEQPTDSVDGWTEEGYLVNNCYYKGPVVVMPNCVLYWNAAPTPTRVGAYATTEEDVVDRLDVEAFSLFKHVDLDLLLIGTGSKTISPSLSFRKRLREYIRCPIEFVSSGDAASSYNILSKEDRAVATCLLLRSS